MMNRRDAICKKIEAVKIWLVRAEQNFINNNSLRGELDLMLAEAEMSDIKKNSSVRQKIFFSINILMVIGIFFTISFIYFAKDDIIFLKDKKIDVIVEEVNVTKVDTLPEEILSSKDISQSIVAVNPLIEIEKNKEVFVPEASLETPPAIPQVKSEVITPPSEKAKPILTAEETREMVKLARESLRR